MRVGLVPWPIGSINVGLFIGHDVEDENPLQSVQERRGRRSKSTIDTSGRGDPSGRHQLSARGGNSEMPTSSIVAPSDRVTRSLVGRV